MAADKRIGQPYSNNRSHSPSPGITATRSWNIRFMNKLLIFGHIFFFSQASHIERAREFHVSHFVNIKKKLTNKKKCSHSWINNVENRSKYAQAHDKLKFMLCICENFNLSYPSIHGHLLILLMTWTKWKEKTKSTVHKIYWNGLPVECMLYFVCNFRTKKIPVLSIVDYQFLFIIMYLFFGYTFSTMNGHF